MTQTQLTQSIIADLKSHTDIFRYSASELNALALGLSQGLALGGLKSPTLDLAIVSDNVPLMIAGGLSD